MRVTGYGTAIGTDCCCEATAPDLYWSKQLLSVGKNVPHNNVPQYLVLNACKKTTNNFVLIADQNVVNDKFTSDIKDLNTKEETTKGDLLNVQNSVNTVQNQTNDIRADYTKKISDLKFQIYQDMNTMKMQLMEEINNVKLEQTTIKSKIDNLQNQVTDLKNKEDLDNSKISNLTNDLNDLKSNVKTQDDKISLMVAIDENQNKSILNISDIANQHKEQISNLTLFATNVSDNFDSYKKEGHSIDWVEGDYFLLGPISFLFIVCLLICIWFWRSNKNLKKNIKELVDLVAFLKKKKVPSLQEILDRSKTEEKESFISLIRQSSFRKSTSLELSSIQKSEEFKCELK